MRTVLALVLLLVAVGCDNPFAPDLPGNAVEWTDELPPHFEDWWREAEAATGVKGTLSAVRFFLVPEPFEADGQLVRGMWVKDGNRIYLAAEQWSDSGGVARHEMAHLLLDDPSHSHPVFDSSRFNSPWSK